jgi:hypothetical protein
VDQTEESIEHVAQPAVRSVRSGRLRMSDVKKIFKIVEEQPLGKHLH